MKYKVGQKVIIRSLEWYNKYKDGYEDIRLKDTCFRKTMALKFCGKVMTISAFDDYKDGYRMLEDKGEFFWTDEMIEGLVEEETKPNIIEEAKTYWDSIKDAWICPEGYQFVDENGNVINETKIVLEKKKKEYPKTYEECKRIMGVELWNTLWGEDATEYEKQTEDLIDAFIRLKVCRDAYWKIAGEEMGLGKPWEPDWNHLSDKWVLFYTSNRVGFQVAQTRHSVFAFPTEEMRDAFKENFDPDIEICKEFL